MKDIPGAKTQVLKRHRYAMPLMPHGKICDGDVAGPMGNRKEERGKGQHRFPPVPTCPHCRAVLVLVCATDVVFTGVML